MSALFGGEARSVMSSLYPIHKYVVHLHNFDCFTHNHVLIIVHQSNCILTCCLPLENFSYPFQDLHVALLTYVENTCKSNVEIADVDCSGLYVTDGMEMMMMSHYHTGILGNVQLLLSMC